MKIRKLLPILVVAVVAVVALSSCDNILAGLFNLHPAGTDSVTVNVDTYYLGYWGVGTAIRYRDLMVVLTDSSGNVVGTPYRISLTFSGDDPIVAPPVTFGGLDAGNYTAYAWIDFDQDSQPTYDYDFNDNWGQSATSTNVSSSNHTGSIDLSVYDQYYYTGTTFNY